MEIVGAVKSVPTKYKKATQDEVSDLLQQEFGRDGETYLLDYDDAVGVTEVLFQNFELVRVLSPQDIINDVFNDFKTSYSSSIYYEQLSLIAEKIEAALKEAGYLNE